MADIQIVDIFNRPLDVQDGMTHDLLRQLIANGMSAELPKPEKVGEHDNDKSKAVQDVLSKLEELIDNSEDGFEDLVKIMEEVAKHQEDNSKPLEELTQGQKKANDAFAKAADDNEKLFRSIFGRASTKAPIKTALGIKSMDRVLKKLAMKMQPGTGGPMKPPRGPTVGTGGPGGGGGGGKGWWSKKFNVFGKNIKEDLDDIERETAKSGYTARITARIKLAHALYEVNDKSRKAIEALTGMDPLAEIMKNIVKGPIEFRQNVKSALFEVQGITAETQELQNEWSRVGKATKDMPATMGLDDLKSIFTDFDGFAEKVSKEWKGLSERQHIVLETGQDALEVQKEYVKNLRRGVKELGQAQKITKASASFATMIGVKAEATSDMFAKWHTELGFSASQLNVVSRGMQQVARYSGLSGENLMQAVKNTEPLLKALRSSGALTEQAAKSMIAIQAAATRLGVSEQVNAFQMAMTGPQNFAKAAPGVQAVLSRIAAQMKMDWMDFQDRLNDKQFMKGFAGNMREQFRQILGMRGNQKFDVKELTKEQRMRGNMLAEQMNLKGVNDFFLTVKTFEEAGMTFADRMAEIDKNLNKSSITKEKETQLNREKTQLMLNESMDILAKVAEKTEAAGEVKGVGESTKALNDAFTELRKGSSTLTADMEALGATGKTEQDKVQQIFTSTAKTLKDKLESKEIQEAVPELAEKLKDYQDVFDDQAFAKAFAAGPAEVTKLLSKLEELRTLYGTAEKASLDETTKFSMRLKLLNAKLQDLTDKYLEKFLKELGRTGTNWLLGIAVAGYALGALVSIVNTLIVLFGGLASVLTLISPLLLGLPKLLWTVLSGMTRGLWTMLASTFKSGGVFGNILGMALGFAAGRVFDQFFGPQIEKWVTESLTPVLGEFSGAIGKAARATSNALVTFGATYAMTGSVVVSAWTAVASLGYDLYQSWQGLKSMGNEVAASFRQIAKEHRQYILSTGDEFSKLVKMTDADYAAHKTDRAEAMERFRKLDIEAINNGWTWAAKQIAPEWKGTDEEARIAYMAAKSRVIAEKDLLVSVDEARKQVKGMPTLEGEERYLKEKQQQAAYETVEKRFREVMKFTPVADIGPQKIAEAMTQGKSFDAAIANIDAAIASFDASIKKGEKTIADAPNFIMSHINNDFSQYDAARRAEKWIPQHKATILELQEAKKGVRTKQSESQARLEAMRRASKQETNRENRYDIWAKYALEEAITQKKGADYEYVLKTSLPQSIEGETEPERKFRRRISLKKEDLKVLGIDASKEMANFSIYDDISNALYNQDINKALKLVEQNKDKLNMNLLAAMFDLYTHATAGKGELMHKYMSKEQRSAFEKAEHIRPGGIGRLIESGIDYKHNVLSASQQLLKRSKAEVVNAPQNEAPEEEKMRKGLSISRWSSRQFGFAPTAVMENFDLYKQIIDMARTPGSDDKLKDFIKKNQKQLDARILANILSEEGSQPRLFIPSEMLPDIYKTIAAMGAKALKTGDLKELNKFLTDNEDKYHKLFARSLVPESVAEKLDQLMPGLGWQTPTTPPESLNRKASPYDPYANPYTSPYGPYGNPYATTYGTGAYNPYATPYGTGAYNPYATPYGTGAYNPYAAMMPATPAAPATDVAKVAPPAAKIPTVPPITIPSIVDDKTLKDMIKKTNKELDDALKDSAKVPTAPVKKTPTVPATPAKPDQKIDDANAILKKNQEQMDKTIADEQKKMDAQLDAQASVLDKITDDAMKALPKITLEDIQKQQKDIIQKQKDLSKPAQPKATDGASDLFNIFKPVQTEQKEGNKSLMESIDKLIEAINKLSGNVSTSFNSKKATDFFAFFKGTDSDKFVPELLGFNNQLSMAKTLENLFVKKVDVPNVTTPLVEPTLPVTARDKMERDRTDTNPPVTEVVGPQLEEMNETEKRQVEILQKVASALEAIKSLLEPSNDVRDTKRLNGGDLKSMLAQKFAEPLLNPIWPSNFSQSAGFEITDVDI